MVTGLVINCEKDLRIRELLFNSLGDSVVPDIPGSLYDIVEGDDADKLRAFADDLENTGFVFEREINLQTAIFPLPLKFTGGKLDDGYFIFVVRTNDDIPFLYEELMKVNNEQANYLRSMASKYTQTNSALKEQDELYNEVSRMNNELSNLHRALEQKNAELNRLNRQKNEFLGIAAHDLRNPLSSVMFYLDFIMEDADRLSEEQKEFVGQVMLSCRSMLNLVNELLDVSAIESGKIRLELGEVHLDQLVEETIQSYRNLAEQKEIEVEIELQQKGIMVRGDAERLRQVLINLYTNAVKFSERKTRILVKVLQKESGGQLVVMDQGKGIAPGELDMLFHPFQKTGTQSTGNEKSTGLGLFIVKKIVDAHQGKIDVRSTPGEGTVFTVTLP